MMCSTKQKAKDILDNQEIVLVSQSPYGFHWMVKQSSGEYCDVWYRTRDEVESWECNSVTNRRKTGSEKWGCVMNVSKQGKPKAFCSHTMACKLWLEKYNSIKTGNFFDEKMIHEKDSQILEGI